MSSTKQTFWQYLALRLLAPFAIVIIVIAFLANHYYLRALDSTAAFYLFEDAIDYTELKQDRITNFRLVSENIELINTLVEFDKQAALNPNEVVYQRQGEFDRYFLAFKDTPKDPIVYVIHSFPVEAESNIFLLLLTIIMSSLLLYGFWLFVNLRALTKQTNLLTEAIKNNNIQTNIKIAEFRLANKRIVNAIAEKHEALKREKYFASFLSHEIRQPLTGLGHNLSRFDQLDDLPLESLPLIETLKQQQKQLHLTSDAILAIWQLNPESTSNNHVKFQDIIKNWTNTELFPTPRVTICHDNKLLVEPNQAALFLRQISDNFKKYGTGPLTIVIDKHDVCFSNAQQTVDKKSVESYGVGSFIMNAISKVWGCTFTMNSVENVYTIRLKQDIKDL